MALTSKQILQLAIAAVLLIILIMVIINYYQKIENPNDPGVLQKVGKNLTVAADIFWSISRIYQVLVMASFL